MKSFSHRMYQPSPATDSHTDDQRGGWVFSIGDGIGYVVGSVKEVVSERDRVEYPVRLT